MKQKIEPKDILKGDKIRWEQKDAEYGTPDAIEYTARSNADRWSRIESDGGEFFLIGERLVALPTEEGYYESGKYPIETGCHAYQLEYGEWMADRKTLTEEQVRNLMPLRKMGSERDIANKVLDELRWEWLNGNGSVDVSIEAVREKYTK